MAGDVNFLFFAYFHAHFNAINTKLQENGFFVESGALDGELNSNSLLFERSRHWTGLLVEPNPYSYKRLKAKHRKAFSINACLSPYPHPAQVNGLSKYNGNISIITE